MMRITIPATLCRLASAAALCALLGACNIVVPAVYFLGGQPKRAAEYTPEDRATVVFVDDRGNAIEQNSLRTRQAIADKITAALMAKEVLTNTIRPSDALAVARQNDRQGNILAIDAIGRSVGAEQVIYVEMLSFRGSVDGITPRPVASCAVRVIDVENRTRLFPGSEAERPSRIVEVISREVSAELYRTASGRREIERLLAAMLADRVAKLFYKHVPDELGSRLDPR